MILTVLLSLPQPLCNFQWSQVSETRSIWLRKAHSFYPYVCVRVYAIYLLQCTYAIGSIRRNRVDMWVEVECALCSCGSFGKRINDCCSCCCYPSQTTQICALGIFDKPTTTTHNPLNAAWPVDHCCHPHSSCVPILRVAVTVVYSHRTVAWHPFLIAIQCCIGYRLTASTLASAECFCFVLHVWERTSCDSFGAGELWYWWYGTQRALRLQWSMEFFHKSKNLQIFSFLNFC